MNMRDEGCDILEARVWLKEADGQVLIGERFRRADGRVTVTWHIDPKSIFGMMWFEPVGNETDASES